jgi:cytidylate kinase
MIIAIDGPAGAGKSTIARALGKELGLFFLDTGAMYRSVANEALRCGVNPSDEEALAQLASDMDLRFGPGSLLTVNGRDVTLEIRREEVEAIVSVVAAHPAVRRAIVPKQKLVAERQGGVVAEGRDMTSVVFATAEFRFFLDASADERARRRSLERGTPELQAAIRFQMEARDKIDSTRKDSPLHLAQGVLKIQTDGKAAQEVMAELLAIIRGSGVADKGLQGMEQ